VWQHAVDVFAQVPAVHGRFGVQKITVVTLERGHQTCNGCGRQIEL